MAVNRQHEEDVDRGPTNSSTGAVAMAGLPGGIESAAGYVFGFFSMILDKNASTYAEHNAYDTGYASTGHAWRHDFAGGLMIPLCGIYSTTHSYLDSYVNGA